MLTVVRISIVCLMAFVPRLVAQEPEAAGAGKSDLEIPADLTDAQFDRFVDLQLVRQALDQLDPVLLVDVTLQISEGERQLGRAHRAVAATALWRVAIRVAVDQRDKTALDRLSRAAKQLDKQELFTLVENAKKLAEAPRSSQPGPKIPLNQLTPEAVVLYQAFYKEIRKAQAFGSRDELERYRVTVGQLNELHPKQREYLALMITTGLAGLPTANPNAVALHRLAGVSRLTLPPADKE